MESTRSPQDQCRAVNSSYLQNSMKLYENSLKLFEFSKNFKEFRKISENQQKSTELSSTGVREMSENISMNSPTDSHFETAIFVGFHVFFEIL